MRKTRRLWCSRASQAARIADLPRDRQVPPSIRVRSDRTALAEAGAPIAPSSGNARKSRPLSARARRDVESLPMLGNLHTANRPVYGARTRHAELYGHGHRVARCTVKRLIRLHGPRGL